MTTHLSCLFAYSLILLITLSTPLEVSCQCLGSERSSLLKFKSRFVLNDRPSLLLDWNASSDCCLWEAVSCDLGHVTRLNLDILYYSEVSASFDNSISSVFPLQHLKSLELVVSGNFSILNLTLFVQNFPELEELRFYSVDISANGKELCQALSSSSANLRVLELRSSTFSGLLDAPELRCIANFSSLTSLDLNRCGLKGSFPREIFQIQTLQSIRLSLNELLQGTLPEFPIDSSLQYIDLSYTDFSGRLPQSIGNLWNLSYLDLTDCRFDGPIPSSIEKITRLGHLSLKGNNFTGPAPSFSLSKYLHEIDISENSLIGDIQSLHLEGLSNLQSISFSRNFLYGRIPSSLFLLPSLEKVDLSYNRFTGCEFAYSSRLDSLDLSHNNLEGSFPTSVLKLESLTYLDLSYNKFNGTVQLNVFQPLSDLYFLDLSYNQFSIEVSDDDSLISFPQVSKLNLASCNLKVFPHLKNQSYLLTLDLSNNQISGEIPNWIWEAGDGEFANLNLSHNNLVGIQEPYSFPLSLGVIDFHSNLFHGKIPIPQFAQYIDFSNNNFSSIQITLNSPHTLGFFSLSNNSLTGGVPESVCNLTGVLKFDNDLGVLDLSHNNLSGRITTCVIEVSDSLEVLNLRKNKFRGPIPDAFPKGCGLKVLDLNGNFIDGEIPKSLAHCTQLEVLDLGHNNIVGEFPCFLKNISSLQVVILQANKLYGDIECPDSNGTWPMLQILDLTQNNLGGELRAKWMENLQAMKNDTNGNQAQVLGVIHHYSFFLTEDISYSELYYQYVVTVTSKGQERELKKILTIFTFIDLSCNDFHGQIPEELGGLQALYTLNLSYNTLSGEIPTSIGNMRKLESLDLSRNSLQGNIPASLSQLNFIQFLDLSFNHLAGPIPKGSQIQTFSEDSFTGNEGLCGFPLRKNCSGGGGTLLPNQAKERHADSGGRIDWNLLSAELGFIVGFGLIVAPLVFLRKWRMLYFERIDDIVVMIFPSAVALKWFRWTTS